MGSATAWPLSVKTAKHSHKSKGNISTFTRYEGECVGAFVQHQKQGTSSYPRCMKCVQLLAKEFKLYKRGLTAPLRWSLDGWCSCKPALSWWSAQYVPWSSPPAPYTAVLISAPTPLADWGNDLANSGGSRSRRGKLYNVMLTPKIWPHIQWQARTLTSTTHTSKVSELPGGNQGIFVQYAQQLAKVLLKEWYPAQSPSLYTIFHEGVSLYWSTMQAKEWNFGQSNKSAAVKSSFCRKQLPS